MGKVYRFKPRRRFASGQFALAGAGRPARKHSKTRPQSLPRRSVPFLLAGLLLALISYNLLQPSLALPSLGSVRDAAQFHHSFSVCSGSARINCVIDGDTIYLDGEKIRIADINTPEISRPACHRERTLANQAQIRLVQLLNAGPAELRRTETRDRDVYGRKLRSIYRNGRSLGDTLIDEGLAHRWRGYKQSWCN
ncbi:thermonuclease family protein [Hoeflea sp.]|uniref:thermonuclease family protein n=1 Tax=Hoeflea sp. TaxID=1940281 RepID=UPI003A8FA592